MSNYFEQESKQMMSLAIDAKRRRKVLKRNILEISHLTKQHGATLLTGGIAQKEMKLLKGIKANYLKVTKARFNVENKDDEEEDDG